MEVMKGFKEFLESSTIHGLVYISITKRIVRLLWICVVIGGFVAAGYMISESFSSWSISPISTTIDTRPITDLNFPTVTVCPPRNSFTSLNPDLVRARDIKFDEEKRKKLSDFVSDFVFQTNYNRRYSAFAAFDGKETWYTGETKIEIPYIDVNDRLNGEFYMDSLNGTFSTDLFGKPLNESRFESQLRSSVVLNLNDLYHSRGKIELDFEYDIDETYNEESIEISVKIWDPMNQGNYMIDTLAKLDIKKKEYHMEYPPENYDL